MNTHHFLTSKAGFTLVELLITIFIIGVLSAIIFPGFAGMREKARDTERMTDVRQIQNALELYFNKNGAYPDDLNVLPDDVPKIDPAGVGYEYQKGAGPCGGGTPLYSLRFTAERPGIFSDDSTVVVDGETVCVDVLRN